MGEEYIISIFLQEFTWMDCVTVCYGGRMKNNEGDELREVHCIAQVVCTYTVEKGIQLRARSLEGSRFYTCRYLHILTGGFRSYSKAYSLVFEVQL